MKYFSLLFVFFIISMQGISQNFMWKSAYEFIGDNREYFSPFGYPQTILASRASQEFGFTVDSTQQIMAGASYLLIHGDNQFSQTPILTLYYQYATPSTHLQIGSFPLEKPLFPKALYCDSLLYFKPNVQGLLASYNSSYKSVHFSYTGVLDWLHQENFGANESFLAGIAGSIRYKTWVSKQYYYYKHSAHDVLGSGKLVQDNGTLLLTLGYTNGDAPLHVSCNIGKLITWHKNRPEITKYSGGLYIDTKLMYKIFGIDAYYYQGDQTYLTLGDPLYKSGNYTRIDAIVNIKKTKQVTCFVSFNTHLIQKEINFSQNLSLAVKLSKE